MAAPSVSPLLARGFDRDESERMADSNPFGTPETCAIEEDKKRSRVAESHPRDPTQEPKSTDSALPVRLTPGEQVSERAAATNPPPDAFYPIVRHRNWAIDRPECEEIDQPVANPQALYWANQQSGTLHDGPHLWHQSFAKVDGQDEIVRIVKEVGASHTTSSEDVPTTVAHPADRRRSITNMLASLHHHLDKNAVASTTEVTADSTAPTGIEAKRRGSLRDLFPHMHEQNGKDSVESPAATISEGSHPIQRRPSFKDLITGHRQHEKHSTPSHTELADL
ncbi:hypothetical protein LTR10_009449 [Elasticomyces elasticus]|nr:hypothetical protein LTR10_009449 [Elasticomyces elasticus]